MSSPTPPNGSIRTAAIMLLFRDGFHVDDLAEIFTLSNFNIEEHLRLAMFNGHVNPVAHSPGEEGESPAPKKARAVRKSIGQKVTVSLSKEPVKPPKRTGECELHAGQGVTARGECRGCLREYQKDWAARRKQTATERTASPKRQRRQRSPLASDQNSEPEKSKSVPTKSRRSPKPRLTQADVNRSPVTPQAETEELPARQNELDNDRPGEMEDVFRKIATRSSAEAAPPEAADTQGKTYSHLIHCPKCGQRHRFWKRANADDSRDHWISMACNNSLKISHYQIKTDRNYRGEAA